MAANARTILPEDGTLLDALIARHSSTPGGLLPLLHDVQATFGYIAEAMIAQIAQALNLSRAEVHGVVHFYHDFRTEAPGRHIIRYCRAEACQARGGRVVEEKLVAALGTAMGSTRADGACTLEPVYCLGLCAIGPNALIDGEPVAALNDDRIADIAQRLRL